MGAWRVYPVILIICIWLTPSAFAGEKFFKVSGIKFRTNNAYVVALGNIGVRKDRLKNVSFDATVKKSWRSVEITLTPHISQEIETSLVGKLKFKIPQIAKVKGKIKKKKKITVDYYVASINREQLIDEINRDDKLLRKLLQSSKFRIITDVVVIDSYKKTGSMQLKGKAKAKLIGFKAKFKGKSKRKETLDLGKGTTLAYQMAKICWYKKSAEIGELVTDLPGKDACPGRLTAKPPKKGRKALRRRR